MDKKVAIYVRVSTEDQTPEDQLKDIIGLVKTKDYDIVIEKQSAWKDDIRARPKFKELINQIKKQQITHLYCWDLDRIYRHKDKFVGFWRLCKINNVKLISYRQQWLNDLERVPEPFGEMIEDWMIKFYGWIAEDESKKKSERVRKAFENHKGKKWGRPKSFTNVYLVCRLRDQGMSLRQISKEVGVSRTQVSRIIKEVSQKANPK